MATTDFVMVCLRRKIEEGKYQRYTCWIPKKLALEAISGKKIRLYFEEKDEWVDGWELPTSYKLDGEISKERANELYDRLQQFRRFKVAGRPSYKD